jgi:ParD-like antitoxin of type II bacterial toxin-antitoxin system
MSQPVKLSDKLILDARITSGFAKRSIAGQIEFWAGLGRGIEALLHSPELESLQKASGVTPLSTALSRVGTPEGNGRVADFLRTQPFPHYEPAPNAPGLLVRIEADGTRTVGRFVQRRFVPATSRRKR